MPDVAVVAHSRKSFGGGLRELREVLAREGVTDPLWYEVKKSRHAPEYARRVAARGADVIFVWGGDGTVQRCIDAVAGTDATVAILPAGTANLLAMNLGISDDLTEAVRVGLQGDRGKKNRLGRAAYLYAGMRNLSARRVKTTVEVDGRRCLGGQRRRASGNANHKPPNTQKTKAVINAAVRPSAT